MVDTTLMVELNEMITIKQQQDAEKEKKRAYMREYMKNRRQKDASFAQKQKELVNHRKKVLRQDSDYVAKEREYNVNYHRRIKKEYLEMKELLKR